MWAKGQRQLRHVKWGLGVRVGGEGEGGRQSAATAPLLWILPETPCPRVAFNNCLYQSNAIFFLCPV